MINRKRLESVKAATEASGKMPLLFCETVRLGIVSLFFGYPLAGLHPCRARPPFPQSEVTSVTLDSVNGLICIGTVHHQLRMVEIGFTPPMGLEQDAIDVGQFDDFGGIADGFEEATDAQVAGTTQKTICGAGDEVERLGRERTMGEATQV